MKLRSLLIIAALVPAFASGQQLMQLNEPGKPAMPQNAKVLRFVLDEMRPVPVPTNPLVTTTIVFPSAIGGVDAVGFSDNTQQGPQNNADFYMGFRDGNSYLSICPLKPNVARNINIFYKGKVYAFEPFPVGVESALTTLIMVNGYSNGDSGNSMASVRPSNPTSMFSSLSGGTDSVIKTRTIPPKSLKTASSASILGVIDTLKTLSIFNRDQLQDALTSMPDMILSVRDGQGPDVTNNGDYSVTIHKVLRQNKLDVLAFEVSIKNNTTHEVHLDPESFTVRRGDKVYYAVTADFDGDLAASEDKIAYFALIGTPEGSPNWLSPMNTFAVSLDFLNDRRDPKPPLSFPDETRQLENPSISDLPYPPTAGANPDIEPPSAPAPHSEESEVVPELHSPGAASLEPPADVAAPMASSPTTPSK